MFFYHFLLPQVEIFSRVVKDAWHPIPLRSFSTQRSVKEKKKSGLSPNSLHKLHFVPMYLDIEVIEFYYRVNR